MQLMYEFMECSNSNENLEEGYFVTTTTSFFIVTDLNSKTNFIGCFSNYCYNELELFKQDVNQVRLFNLKLGTHGDPIIFDFSKVLNVLNINSGDMTFFHAILNRRYSYKINIVFRDNLNNSLDIAFTATDFMHNTVKGTIVNYFNNVKGFIDFDTSILSNIHNYCIGVPNNFRKNISLSVSDLGKLKTISRNWHDFDFQFLNNYDEFLYDFLNSIIFSNKRLLPFKLILKGLQIELGHYTSIGNSLVIKIPGVRGNISILCENNIQNYGIDRFCNFSRLFSSEDMQTLVNKLEIYKLRHS